MSSCTKPAHHWILDLSNKGICKYCGEERQFNHPSIYDLSQPRSTIHDAVIKAHWKSGER